MQQKHPVNQSLYPIPRFFELFCSEVIAKFFHYRKPMLDFTVFQTAQKLIIIYQNNELNLAYHRDYITVQWWSGYHRFNGQQHPDYPLTQIKRAYYKLHEKSRKVFRTGLEDESFNGHELSLVSEAAYSVVRQYCIQQQAMHIMFLQHPK